MCVFVSASVCVYCTMWQQRECKGMQHLLTTLSYTIQYLHYNTIQYLDYKYLH